MIKYWNLLQRCNQMHRINISTQSRLFKMMMEPLHGSMLQPARKPKFLIKKNEREKKKKKFGKNSTYELFCATNCKEGPCGLSERHSRTPQAVAQ